MSVSTAKLHQKFARARSVVHANVMEQLQKSAEEMTAFMNAIKPLPEIQVDWRAGGKRAAMTAEPPGESEAKVTIYATARTEEYPAGFPAIAAWFEYGTNARFIKSGPFRGKYTGQITAQPFFWPVYRANRRLVKGRISRAIRRGLRSVN